MADDSDSLRFSISASLDTAIAINSSFRLSLDFDSEERPSGNEKPNLVPNPFNHPTVSSSTGGAYAAATFRYILPNLTAQPKEDATALL